MELTLLNFSKRINSTKKPTAEQLAAGKVFSDLTLKQLTNIDNPNLLLAGAKENDYKFNYAYVKEWDRYYHIKTSDLRHEDIYTARLELDDLATFKDDILATSAYIVYSTTGFNRWIRDDRVPLIIKDSEILTGASNPMVGGASLFEAVADETVILTCQSKGSYVGGGGLTHWIMRESDISKITGTVFDASSIWEDLQKQFGDAMGAIVSVIRLPINPNAIPSAGPYIFYLSNFQPVDDQGNPFSFNIVSNSHISASGDVSIPLSYTDFRFTEPYTQCKISLPFIGVTDISISDFVPTGQVNYRIDLDVLTGSIIYTLYNTGLARPVASFSGQCGNQIPIVSTQTQNASSIVSGFLGGAASIGTSLVTGNPIPAVIGGIGSIANAFYAANQKTNSVIGSYSGGRSEFANREIRLISQKFKTANEPSNLADFEGRPVCKVDTLSNYSGYIKTQGFSIDIAANSDVINSINKKLDAGIYIE